MEARWQRKDFGAARGEQEQDKGLGGRFRYRQFRRHKRGGFRHFWWSRHAHSDLPTTERLKYDSRVARSRRFAATSSAWAWAGSRSRWSRWQAGES